MFQVYKKYTGKINWYRSCVFIINLFHFNILFPQLPPGNIRKTLLFYFIRGYRKKTLAWNGLIDRNFTHTVFWCLIVHSFQFQCCVSYRNQSFDLLPNICYLVSIWDATLGWNELLLACNFSKSNTPPWVFFHIFKTIPMVPNRATHCNVGPDEQSDSSVEQIGGSA